jgi:hypothetical protein
MKKCVENFCWRKNEADIFNLPVLAPSSPLYGCYTGPRFVGRKNRKAIEYKLTPLDFARHIRYGPSGGTQAKKGGVGGERLMAAESISDASSREGGKKTKPFLLFDDRLHNQMKE